ncbi:MAG: lysine N(6)-hydroxylase/L-ornithine N(5)-oxygenase family protein [Actinobacteria bacterium]|nr:MAG: lysine N(6)-hydroxylase/L-ornithine N(5)-oxygenase family protein [Actinomycetota bacterium]
MSESDILIVGAGAKAAAIAAKVHTINSLGLGEISMTVIEKTEPAASWLGRNGMTSGEEPLAIPPIKDVGFPYQSSRQFGALGDEIDAALLPLTWQRFAMERHEYATWVNSGSPSVMHRDYGEYLGWVLERATEGVRIYDGRVTEVSLSDEGDRWQAEVAERGQPEDPERHTGRILVLTGPGVHRHFPHDPEVESRVFHCDSRREELARVPEGEPVEIAIIGGGESALSALVFLRDLRPQARLTIYTPTLPLSRGESFLENRVFADPDNVDWEHLDIETRRDFVKHCDRGVSLASDGEGALLEFDSPSEGETAQRYDYVVNCTGFDLLRQLRGLFPDGVRDEVEEQCGPLWDSPPKFEVPIGRGLELEGVRPRLHIPGLGGLRQGPGFANLGSLGLLANRVLQPLLEELEVPTAPNSAKMQDKSLLLD